jgi:DNA ligase-1
MIPAGFKPMLAIDSGKVKKQNFPMLLSEKLDGIRCISFGGVAYSRSLKPLPNKFIQKFFSDNASILHGLDGELIVGDKNAKDVFNATTSGVMSESGEPDFTFWVFDYIPPKAVGYGNRLSNIDWLLGADFAELGRVKILDHFDVSCQEDIDKYEAYYLSIGAEGVMLRDPDGDYKFGRSGSVNPELQKVKRFCTEEFEIIGYEPKYVNTNEAKINELGRTERSSSKDGLVAIDTLGTLHLKTSSGLEFSSGSGLTDEARDYLWKIKDSLIGKLASIKYFAVGDYNVPRFPVMRGIRDVIDL